MTDFSELKFELRVLQYASKLDTLFSNSSTLFSKPSKSLHDKRESTAKSIKSVLERVQCDFIYYGIFYKQRVLSVIIPLNIRASVASLLNLEEVGEHLRGSPECEVE